MALLRTKEIRAMDAAAREKKLRELRDELMHERGVAAMGGAPPNPGKIRALRKNIARLYTIQSEEGHSEKVRAESAPVAAPKGPDREAPSPKDTSEQQEGIDTDPEEDQL